MENNKLTGYRHPTSDRWRVLDRRSNSFVHDEDHLYLVFYLFKSTVPVDCFVHLYLVIYLFKSTESVDCVVFALLQSI